MASSHRRVALLVLCALALPVLSVAQSQTLQCASNSAGRSYCAADTSSGVRLTRQLSDAPCTQDVSWGYDASGVWVSQGCRADFEVMPATLPVTNGAAAGTVRCESEDNNRRHCAADTRGGVRLTQQLSDAPCVQGSTWGNDATGVWVDRGCGADFQMLPVAVTPTPEPASYAHTLRCYSTGYARHDCAADTRGGVRLTRQLGHVTCREGSTWGYTAHGVWVARGCRGEFELLPVATAVTSATTVHCESVAASGYGRQSCPADTRGGVRLMHRTSSAPCTEGRSWGYDSTGIWVDHGCGADFALTASGRGVVAASTVLPRGTDFAVRNNDTIDSKTAVAGQHFSGVVAVDVLDSTGRVAIPKGSDADLVIRSSVGGSITTASDLVLTLDSVTVRGVKYVLTTADVERKGAEGLGKNRKTAEIVGGSAVLGSLIGAIAGHGKGAAIGAAVGAATGAGAEVLTKGQEVRVPSETILHFKLDQDLALQTAH